VESEKKGKNGPEMVGGGGGGKEGRLSLMEKNGEKSPAHRGSLGGRPGPSDERNEKDPKK